MTDLLWAVVLGAAIASVVPIVSLFVNNKRWRLEKRIEILRFNHEQLERHYSEILEQLAVALRDDNYPQAMISKISMHAAPDARALFFGHIDTGGKDGAVKKDFYRQFVTLVDRHIVASKQEIYDALS
jgi:hypothetical protein